MTKLVGFQPLMWSHLPLKGMMVTICVECETKNIMVLLTRFMPPSLNTQVTLTNGHCEAIFVIMLLFYWLIPTLHQRISLSIVAPVLGLTVVVWNPYASTWHTYNWMTVRLMMKITNKIRLTKSALSTLVGGLWPWDEDGRCDNVNVPKRLSTPMDWALICLHETMAKITIECGEGASIKLCNHATLLVWGVASNIRTTIWPKSTNPCTQE